MTQGTVVYRWHHESATGTEARIIWLEQLADGQRQLIAQEIGGAVERAFGDPDLEYWLILPPDTWEALLPDILGAALGGQPVLTLARLRDICIERGFAHQWGEWS